MSRWFRMYSDVLDDPKVQRLPPDLFKAWVNLLCLASRNGGMLPGVEDIAFALRMSQDVTRNMVRDLSQRGLLDDADGLTPHNWNERQFRSDKDETASERKRRQREREKQPIVTDDVTRDTTVTSRPPEQNRSEQIRTHTERVCDVEPEHTKDVQDFLDNRAEDLNAWEQEFLISIKWTDTLSKAQSEKLQVIRDKLRSVTSGGHVLPSVKRGTPEYDAWIAYYKRTGRPTAFYEKLEQFTVLSEYPPQEQAA